MVGRKHDCVALRTFGAERGQRAARGPDGVEFVNLDDPFSACFFHVVSPAPCWTGLLPSLTADPIIGGLYLAHRADVSSGCSKKSFGFS